MNKNKATAQIEIWKKMTKINYIAFLKNSWVGIKKEFQIILTKRI